MLAARFTGLITAVNNTAVRIDESTRNEGTLTGQWNYTVTKIDAVVIDDWWRAGRCKWQKALSTWSTWLRPVCSPIVTICNPTFVDARSAYATGPQASEILVSTSERDEHVETGHRSAFILAFSTSKLLNPRPLPLLFIKVIGDQVSSSKHAEIWVTFVAISRLLN